EAEKRWSHGGSPIPPYTTDSCSPELNLGELEKHWSHKGSSVPFGSPECGTPEFVLAQREEYWSPTLASVPLYHSECCAPQSEDPHQELLALATGHLRFNPDSRLAT